MKRILLWFALLVLICVLVTLSVNARADSFDNLPYLDNPTGDARAKRFLIKTARRAYQHDTLPRFGYELVLVGGTPERPTTVAVPVSLRGKSLMPGYVLRQMSKNGVNSRFEVLEPRGMFVAGMVRRMRGRPVYYVPWSPALDTLELRAAGLEGYLIGDGGVLDSARDSLAGVRSRFAPGRLITEVVPEDIIITLILVEHIDGTKMRSGDSILPQVHKVLVMLGANEGIAFRYSRSRAGARGIGQIMPATYVAMRRNYPGARLFAGFVRGTDDHVNSVKAMYCIVDSIIANMPPWQRRRFTGREKELAFYVAATYNAGPQNAPRMFSRYMFARGHRTHVARKMYIGKFEAIWNLR